LANRNASGALPPYRAAVRSTQAVVVRSNAQWNRYRSEWTTVLAVGLGVLLLVGVVVQSVLAASRPGLFGSNHDIPNAVIGVIGDGVGEILVGMVLASRLPRNPIGWLLLGFGASTELLTGGGALALAGYGPGHPSLLAQAALVVANVAQIFLVGTIFLVVALFPSGRVVGRARRLMVRASLLILALLTVALMLAPKITEQGGNGSYPNPLGVSGLRFLQGIGKGGGNFVFVAFLVVVSVDALLRGLRSRGVERQQMKFFGYAAVGWLVILFAGGFIPSKSAWSSVDWTVGSNLIAIAIGVAVLRYRLYDLDRVASRTVSYAVVTGILVGVYVGLVTLTTRVLPFSSAVGVAASTLAAAALFNPLRRRIQHAVDRRFNRARYNADATAAAFAERLRAAVDLSTIRRDLTAVTHATLEPQHVSLWLAGQPSKSAP
jgi:hypothetical protein